jgi:hypothetical protein
VVTEHGAQEIAGTNVLLQVEWSGPDAQDSLGYETWHPQLGIKSFVRFESKRRER